MYLPLLCLLLPLRLLFLPAGRFFPVNTSNPFRVASLRGAARRGVGRCNGQNDRFRRKPGIVESVDVLSDKFAVLHFSTTRALGSKSLGVGGPRDQQSSRLMTRSPSILFRLRLRFISRCVLFSYPRTTLCPFSHLPYLPLLSPFITELCNFPLATVPPHRAEIGVQRKDFVEMPDVF